MRNGNQHAWGHGGGIPQRTIFKEIGQTSRGRKQEKEKMGIAKMMHFVRCDLLK